MLSSRSTLVDIASATAEEVVVMPEDEMPEPKMDITHVHVTTLDEVVSVGLVAFRSVKLQLIQSDSCLVNDVN